MLMLQSPSCPANRKSTATPHNLPISSHSFYCSEIVNVTDSKFCEVLALCAIRGQQCRCSDIVILGRQYHKRITLYRQGQCGENSSTKKTLYHCSVYSWLHHQAKIASKGFACWDQMFWGETMKTI